MIYSIGILAGAIKKHNERIKELEKADPEMQCDEIFNREEIQERKLYIKELKESIGILENKIE